MGTETKLDCKRRAASGACGAEAVAETHTNDGMQTGEVDMNLSLLFLQKCFPTTPNGQTSARLQHSFCLPLPADTQQHRRAREPYQQSVVVDRLVL